MRGPAALATLGTRPDYLEQLYTFDISTPRSEVIVAYFALLSAEAFRRAASSGGAALMTANPGSVSDSIAYAALGSGGADRGAGPTLLDRTLRKSGVSLAAAQR